jgi:Beta-lactamase
MGDRAVYSTKRPWIYGPAVVCILNVLAGATSLFTTVEDLVQWIGNFEDGRVGGKPAVEQMLQPGVLNNGKKLDYAFGLALGKYRGLRTIGHGGADAGDRSDIVWFPDQRFGVAVLSNLGSLNPGDLARQVADVYLMDQLEPQPTASPKTEPASAQVDPRVYDKYVGKYGLPGMTIAVTRESDRLMAQATVSPKSSCSPNPRAASTSRAKSPPSA